MNETLSISVTTGEPLKPPVITILNNNTWCNTTKTAQIQGVEGYTIRYTTDGSNPSSTTGIALTGTGTQSITLSTEQCVVKAIYVNNNNTSKVTGVGVSEKAKIDKTPPSITSINLNPGDESVTASWSGSDSVSGLHEQAYRYKFEDSASWSDWTNATTYTFTKTEMNEKKVSGTMTLEVKDKVGYTKSESRTWTTTRTNEPPSKIPNPPYTWNNTGKHNTAIWVCTKDTNRKNI